MSSSWRSPKTEVRASAIHGLGLFAREDIRQDEVAAVKGGHIVTGERWQQLQPLLGAAEIQIADNLFITPISLEERDGSMLYTNHSCEPNLGLSGNIVFVAMRAIAAGEELTHDWCMTDDGDGRVHCQCGASNCRGVITGLDWRRPELQQKYAGYFSSYLARKITRE